MAVLQTLTIENYRSISEQIVLNFPDKKPIVLIGENNAGKSNIIRALDILFGEFHPKYKDTENFDHFSRNPELPVIIEAKVNGLTSKVGFNPPQGVIGFRYKSVAGQDAPFYCAVKDDGNAHEFVKNELRGEITSIIVNAQHDLTYQLSYTSKFTLLSKVMKAFHKKLTTDQQKVDTLKLLYSEIQDEFNAVPEFKAFKDDMSSVAGEILSNMTYKLEMDFSAYDPSNYFKSLRVNPCENGEARCFDELGTGQQQLLALAFAHAYSKSFMDGDIILVLDEPESHLHPLAQKWLAKRICKMADDGLQIIITTHSPFFINLLNIEGLYLIRKDTGSTTVTNQDASKLYKHCIATGAHNTKTQEATVVPFYANHSTPHILNGFFAKKIVLVEGLTEELTLPVYLERVGLDVTSEGIEILGVQGKGNLAKWWRLFTLYKIPTFVCFDNDSKNDPNGIHRADSLKAIGIKDSELEDILNGNDWNINSSYCVFGKDFETTMKASFPDYIQVEAQQKLLLGTSSKHILSRETAKLISNEECPGWQHIIALKEYLLALD